MQTRSRDAQQASYRLRAPGMVTRLPFLLLFTLCLAGCDRSEAIATGQTAWDRVELVAEMSEPITGITVREGDTVQPGDIVLRQAPEKIEAQLEQARAGRDEAAARLAELRRGPRRELIEESQARLRGAQSRMGNAAEQLRRVRELVAENLAPQADLDEAKAGFDSREADTEAARAGLQALLEGTTVEELQQAEAAFRRAQARVSELEVVRARLDIAAPRAGVIDALPFEEGERPAAGATVAVMLVGPQPYARVYIPEPYRSRVRSGMTLPVRVDGVAAPLQGRVRFVAEDAAFTPFFALTEHDRSRLSYVAEIDLVEERSRHLAAGALVEVDLSGLTDE